MPLISDRNQTAESSEPKDGFTLSDQVPAGATDQETSLEVDQAATVERLSIRIYPGAQLDLELRPVVRQERGNTSDQNLIEYAGKEYIDGDDEQYHWDLSVPIEQGDKIVIQATNRDGSNAYDYRANLDIDYQGGSSRGLLNAIGGVF